MPTPAKITADFSNVEDRREGGKALHAPEGDYLLQVNGASVKKNKDNDGQHILWLLKAIKPTGYESKGLVYHRTSLKPEVLWSLRNFLEDLGINVPKSKVEIPLAKIVEKKMVIGATLGDGEPYNGKVKSEIAATFKKADYQDSGTPAAKASDDDEDDTSSDTTETADDDLEEIDVDDL